MSYTAIIARIKNVRKHPNADRLQIGTASGFSIIVGLDTEEDTLGIFFPEDGQLSLEMCKNNNLHRHTEFNKDSEVKGGFFEDNRRVRVQKLRKELSEGFWVPLSFLEWTEGDLSSLTEGKLLTDFNKKPICNRYYNQATIKAQSTNQQAKNKKKKSLASKFPQFKEHNETGKLRLNLHRVPSDTRIIITEKLEGTSGRTGRLPEVCGPITALKELHTSFLLLLDRCFYNSIKKLFKLLRIKKRPRSFAETKEGRLSRFVDKIEKKISFVKYSYISGSRRVILDPDLSQDKGFYSGKTFRSDIHKMIEGAGLHSGETLYYEIVGYDDDGGQIMGSHDNSKLNDKAFVKKWGKRMTYSYGCTLDNLSPNYKVFVYRITVTAVDGVIYEMPWHKVKTRCNVLGLAYVPELREEFTTSDNPKEELMELCKELTQGPSTLDDSHIKEGVCIRFEQENWEDYTLKFKSLAFCLLNGIQSNDPDYIDPEEAS